MYMDERTQGKIPENKYFIGNNFWDLVLEANFYFIYLFVLFIYLFIYLFVYLFLRYYISISGNFYFVS